MFEDRVGRRKTDASNQVLKRESARIRGDMAMSDHVHLEQAEQMNLLRLREERRAREADIIGTPIKGDRKHR